MKKSIFIFGLFLIINSQLKSQTWEDITPTNTIGIGNIQDFCFSQNYGVFVCGINGIWRYNNNNFDTIYKTPYTSIVKSVAISNDTVFFLFQGLKKMKLGESAQPYQILGINDTIMNTTNRMIFKNNKQYYNTAFGIICYDGNNSEIIPNTLNITNQNFDIDNNNNIYFWRNDSICKIVNQQIIVISDTVTNVIQLKINPHTNELFYLNNRYIYIYNGTSIEKLSVITSLIDYNNLEYKVNFFTISNTQNVIFTYYGQFQVAGFLNYHRFYELQLPSAKSYVIEIPNKILLLGSRTYHSSNSFLTSNYVDRKYGILDKGNYRALINADGMLFWKRENQFVLCEYPKFSRNNTGFASSLWFSGINQNNDTCVAAMRFGQVGEDFWAGPVSNMYDDAYDQKYKRVWLLSNNEVEYQRTNFDQANYIMPEAVASWPAHGNVQNGEPAFIAPFNDVNENGIYDPINGDYPIILGEQALYFIYNDVRNEHTESGGQKLGIEVHGMAYIMDTLNEIQRNTMFLKYNIFNRQNNYFSEFMVGKFEDIDIGYPYNDFIGCDTIRQTYYFYNGRTDDTTNGQANYQYGPPVQAVTFLNNDMNQFIHFNNSSSDWGMNDPEIAPEYYGYMKGFWRDGLPYTVGGNGRGGTIPTKFVFPGNPLNPNEWSEVSAGNNPFDRRGMASIVPQSFSNGKGYCMDIAYVYSGECADTSCTNLSNIPSMFNRVDTIRNYFNNEALACTMTNFTFHSTNFPEIQNYQVVSTFFNNTEIDYSIPIDSVQLYDFYSINPHSTITSWRIYQQNNIISLPNILFNVQNNIPVILSINLMHNPSEKIMNSHSILYFTNGIVGIADVSFNSIKVFPNPASQNIRISGIENVQSIEINDLLGSTVFKTDINNLYYMDIDVSKFKKGIYILKTTSKEGRMFTKKIVVQ